MEVRIKLLNPKAKIPSKKYDDDFCYDCYATSCEEIAPHVFKYGLGIALQIKEVRPKCLRSSITHAISIRPRSSIWETGMVLSNSVIQSTLTIQAKYLLSSIMFCPICHDIR